MAREVVGLIAAGGTGSRLGVIPCSKELFPVGWDRTQGSDGGRPKVVSHYLLEKMRNAGIRKAYVILRHGKWDIPAYWRDGSMVDMELAYLVSKYPYGAPYTLDRAYAFVRDSIVAFGFPDILFDGDAAFTGLLQEQAGRGCDVLLGLFPADRPQQLDVVDVDSDGRVGQIVERPQATRLRKTWGIAVWTPVFTEYIRSYVAARVSQAPENAEPAVGQVIARAIREGLRVEAKDVSDVPYLDIGTPGDLFKGIQVFAAGGGCLPGCDFNGEAGLLEQSVGEASGEDL